MRLAIYSRGSTCYARRGSKMETSLIALLLSLLQAPEPQKEPATETDSAATAYADCLIARRQRAGRETLRLCQPAEDALVAAYDRSVESLTISDGEKRRLLRNFARVIRDLRDQTLGNVHWVRPY